MNQRTRYQYALLWGKHTSQSHAGQPVARHPFVLPLCVAVTALSGCCCGDDDGSCEGTCEGTPISCSQIEGAYDCGSQRGCSYIEVCSGDIVSCSEYGVSEFQCFRNYCAWNGQCSGTIASGTFEGHSCESMSDRPTMCEDTPGCTFSGGCEEGDDRPARCSAVQDISDCTTEIYEGCYRDLACRGESLPCSELNTENSCLSHAGCTWSS